MASNKPSKDMFTLLDLFIKEVPLSTAFSASVIRTKIANSISKLPAKKQPEIAYLRLEILEDYLCENEYIRKLDKSDGFVITEKGKDAKSAGGISYFERDLKRELEARRSEFWPKKYWWVVAILTYLLGLLTDFIKSKL